MGRKKGPQKNVKDYTEDDLQREDVLAMAVAGLPQERMASILKISVETLLKLYAYEVSEGKDVCYVDAVKYLMTNVRLGKEASIFFYLKTRHNWREVQQHEHSGPGGAPIGYKPVDGPPQETFEEWQARKNRESKEADGSSVGTATGAAS